jgi:hypothetical protein
MRSNSQQITRQSHLDLCVVVGRKVILRFVNISQLKNLYKSQKKQFLMRNICDFLNFRKPREIK